MSNLAFSFYFLFLVKLQIHSDTSTHSSQAQAYKEFLDICIRFFLLLLVFFFFSTAATSYTHRAEKVSPGFFQNIPFFKCVNCIHHHFPSICGRYTCAPNTLHPLCFKIVVWLFLNLFYQVFLPPHSIFTWGVTHIHLWSASSSTNSHFSKSHRSLWVFNQIRMT